MTLTNDDLFGTDAVEIRFRADADAQRAAAIPSLGETLRERLAGCIALVRPGLVHELRSHLQAMGIEHDEQVPA
jgi:hypothetical protein